MKLISFILCILIATAAAGQVDSMGVGEKNISLFPNELIQKPLFAVTALDTVSSMANNTSLMFSQQTKAIPLVEYNTTIFCKFEHQLMMSSKLPLKMRLGDVQYVDRLEGKR